MNTNPELHSQPKISTLQSSVFIRGDLLQCCPTLYTQGMTSFAKLAPLNWLAPAWKINGTFQKNNFDMLNLYKEDCFPEFCPCKVMLSVYNVFFPLKSTVKSTCCS